MSIYVVTAICLTLLCVFRQKRWPLFVSLALLLVVGGLRDVTVGTDTKHYAMFFELYGADVKLMYHANEPLYQFLQFVTASCGWGYVTMQFLTECIILSVLFFYTVKTSRNPHYSILCYFLLYFFFYSFNTVRQYLAIPFALLSFYYLQQRKWRNYLICLVIACLFHYSAIICVIAFLIDKYKFSKNMLYFFLIFTFVVGLTPYVLAMVRSLAFQGMFYEIYTMGNVSYRESLFSFSRLLLTIYAICLVYFLKEKETDVSLFVVGVCLLNLFAYYPVIGRLAQYFTIVQITIIPNIPMLLEKKGSSSLISVISFVYIFVTWVYLISSNVAEVVPWKYGGNNLFM